MPKDSLVINIEDTLRFFDEIPDWSKGHITAIVGILGEDLSAATLKHCLEQNGAQHVRIRPGPVKNPGRKGPWLDRWVEADLPCGNKVIFQTEIKSYTAAASGGKILPLNASDRDIADLQKQMWQRQWDSDKETLRNHYVAKVLVPMTLPEEAQHRTLLPMLIFWQVIDPRCSADAEIYGKGQHLFRIGKVTYDFPFSPPGSWNYKCKFKELWAFSVSNYLRFLLAGGCRELALSMPDAISRLQALDRLCKTAGLSST